MSPFPTPCKGKSKSQPFAHTFALTGRRRLYTDTQGVALGYELVALSGRSFSRFVRLSCAHALPLIIWLKSAFLLNNKVRRSPGAKHCSSLCSQSEGANIVAAKHELKIQQSHAPERWSCSLRVCGPHFASKVIYNAGAATDDCAGAAQISAARALPLSLIFSGFLTPYFRRPRPFFPRCSPLPALSSLFSDSLCPSANLGADAFVSAPRYDCISPQVRLRLLPRSLAGIGRVLGKKHGVASR